MDKSRTVTIAVDAVGGDFAPDEVLGGVRTSLAADPGLAVALCGPADVVTPFAVGLEGRLTPVVTSQVIAMDEHPATAVRTKKDSSIVVGCRLVRERRADGFFSAGSTGAVMAAATLVIGRIRGVKRPATAIALPAAGGPVVLLDVGANADCKPENLVQFGIMGVAYAQAVLGVAAPRVALLNIGEEPTKGSLLAIEAHERMVAQVPGFIGNIEGRDLMERAADVVVTDGFTGNVTLKLLEGTSKSILSRLKAAMTSGAVNKAAAAVLKPSLMRLKSDLDPDQYGGAPLLGVNGVAIIAHGSSRADAVANGILVAARACREGLSEKIVHVIAPAVGASSTEEDA
ncbi:MAG: phosphate acyltransferase PlsX [Coriobacteriia bacterium]|nr:phosphate acyltransferase PlsX [Coriobacteriia bacterium]